MTQRRFVHRGRTISFDVPDPPARADDDRCEECRERGIAHCPHHHARRKRHGSHEGRSMTSDMPEQMQNDVSGHDVSGHDMSGHDVSGHDMSGHDMSGHDMSAQGTPTDPRLLAPGFVMPPDSMTHREFEMVIDGEHFPVHVNRLGEFHSHELPFLKFDSADELAKALATRLEIIERGNPQKPEETE